MTDTKVPHGHGSPEPTMGHVQAPDSLDEGAAQLGCRELATVLPNLLLLLMGRVLASPHGVQALVISMDSPLGWSSVSVPVPWSAPSGLVGKGFSCHPNGQEGQT